MSDVSRAFQLCQNGAEAELASMLQSRTIDAAACQTTGMYSGWSLLHAAASKGHMRIVQMLLAAGAPASACNPKSLTPAQVAHEKFTPLSPHCFSRQRRRQELHWAPRQL